MEAISGSDPAKLFPYKAAASGIGGLISCWFSLDYICCDHAQCHVFDGTSAIWDFPIKVGIERKLPIPTVESPYVKIYMHLVIY